MSVNERSPRERSLPDPTATVVAGTPSLALARSKSTAPLGARKPGVSASGGSDTQAPTAAVTPATDRGFQPAPMPRGRFGETVVGVGPEVLRSLVAGVARRAPITAPGAAVAPAVASPAPAAPAAVAPAVASSPNGTQISLSAPGSEGLRSDRPRSAGPHVERPRVERPRVERPRVEAPSLAPRRPAPRAKGQPESGQAESRTSRPGLFRKAAVEARRGEAEQAQVDFLAGFKPKGWSILLLLASLVGVLFVGAALATVEVTAEGQGMLRAPRGLRPVASVLGGSLSEVLVQSGDHVETGEVVARLEGTELRASLVSRERELATTQREVTDSDRRDRQIEERASSAMQRRRVALQGRISINNEKLVQRRKQSENYAELERQGGASATESLTMKEALQSASENVSQLSAELALLDLEIADRARQWQERDAARRLQLSRAEANVEEARTLVNATEIKAPAGGQIESLLVSPGNVVEAGGLLANVVPSGAPRTIVAFVPSRDIAFVTPGAAATVEVQSLSISEFGLGKAKVTRVSSDVATPTEVQATLGEVLQGTVVRVELELVDSESSARMDPHLRSGERATIRLHRRDRRVITLLFDFVRRWVQQ